MCPLGVGGTPRPASGALVGKSPRLSLPASPWQPSASWRPLVCCVCVAASSRTFISLNRTCFQFCEAPEQLKFQGEYPPEAPERKVLRKPCCQHFQLVGSQSTATSFMGSGTWLGSASGLRSPLSPREWRPGSRPSRPPWLAWTHAMDCDRAGGGRLSLQWGNGWHHHRARGPSTSSQATMWRHLVRISSRRSRDKPRELVKLLPSISKVLKANLLALQLFRLTMTYNRHHGDWTRLAVPLPPPS